MAPTTSASASASASSSKPPRSDLLRFSGHAHLRQRILLSILSGKSIRVDSIRSNDVSVGMREYEINLLRLVEKVTNGTTIEISVTGTSFLLHPGLLPGGSFTHNCHVGKSIGWYLEVLVPLGPFCKRPLDISLTGVTGEEGGDMTVSQFLPTHDLRTTSYELLWVERSQRREVQRALRGTNAFGQVDMIRTVTLPHLHLFGVMEGLELQVSVKLLSLLLIQALHRSSHRPRSRSEERHH